MQASVSVYFVIVLVSLGEASPAKGYTAFIPSKSSDTVVLKNLDGPIVAKDLSYLSEGIRALVITFSSVTYLEDGALCAAPNLDELELHRNSPFPEMTRGTFKNCWNLRKLALRYNDGLTIKPEVFEGLVSLERLELRGQVVKQLSSAYFRHTPRLRSLLIWSGEIERIEPGTFDGLRNLEELKLRFNPLQSVDGVLRSLTRLRDLNLGDNRLKSFPWEDMEGASGLEVLSLKGNPVQNYDAWKILRYLKSLKVLNVEDHPLPCKEMLKIVGELQTRNRGLMVHHFTGRGYYDSCEDDKEG